MTPIENNSGKITLAKVEQKLEDHCEQQEKDFSEIKVDIKDIKTDMQKMMNILTSGDGKIKRNYMFIDNHIKGHRWWAVFIVSICVGLATITSIVIASTK